MNMDIENALEMVSELLLFIDTYQVPTVDTTVNHSLYERNSITHVISEEVLKELRPIKYKNAINKEKYTSCCIMQENFQEDDDIIQVPCEHCFFSEAILKWLTEESNECPVCKYRFASMEKKVFSEEICVENIDFNFQNDYIIQNIIPQYTNNNNNLFFTYNDYFTIDNFIIDNVAEDNINI